jgi:tetratricopeptide (TPR) repeat protein
MEDLEHHPGRAASRRWWAVLAAALLLRAALLVLFQRSPLAGVYRADTLYYRTWALGLLDGSWPGAGVYEQGPLYAWLLAALHPLTGGRETLVVGAQMVAGSLTAVLAYACSLRLFGARAAVCAGVLAAGYGPFLLHETLLTKNFLEPLLALAALWAGLRFGESRRLRWAALAGGFLGLAALVREVHVLLLAPLALWLWRPGARPGDARRGGAAAVTALVGGFALVLTPVTARNLGAGGEFAVVTAAGGENFYLGFGPDAAGYYRPPPFVSTLPHLEHVDFRAEARLRTGRWFTQVESSRYWFREALREVAGGAWRAALLVAERAAALVNDYEMPDNEDYQVATRYLSLLRVLPTFGWVCGLGLAGLWFIREIPGRRDAWLPAGCIAALAFGILLTFVIGRYRLAFVAIWLPLAGRGAAGVWELAASRSFPRLVVPALLIAGGSALAFSSPPRLDPERVVYKQGLYAREVEEAARVRDRLEDLQAGAGAEPRDPGRQVELGRALARTGRVPEAMHAFSRALTADPGYVPAHAGLAWVSSTLGRSTEAIAHLEAITRKEPASATALAELGGALARAAVEASAPATADLERQAEERLAQALRFDPGLAEAHIQIARLYMIRGERARAAKELARAFELAPDNAEARRLRSLLGTAGQ